jgi:hypothetical protein
MRTNKVFYSVTYCYDVLSLHLQMNFFVWMNPPLTRSHTLTLSLRSSFPLSRLFGSRFFQSLFNLMVIFNTTQHTLLSESKHETMREMMKEK